MNATQHTLFSQDLISAQYDNQNKSLCLKSTVTKYRLPYKIYKMQQLQTICLTNNNYTV